MGETTAAVPQPKLIGTVSKGAKKLQIMWEAVDGVTYYIIDGEAVAVSCDED